MPFVTRSRNVLCVIPLVLIVIGIAAGSIHLASKFEHPHPLFVAAAHDDVELLNEMLDAGEDVNFKDANSSSALQWAISARADNAVDLLIERGADLSNTSRIGGPLQWAAIWGNAATIDRLIEAGCDPAKLPPSRATLLQLSVFNRDGAAHVKHVLKLGIDVNAVDPRGQTALLNACRARLDDQIVPLLIEQGADVNLADSTGRTPLMVAATGDSVTDVRALLDAGADPEAIDDEGRNALGYVAWLVDESGDIARLLLEHGTPMIAHQGKMPLEEAAEGANEQGIRVLIEHGADPAVATGGGTIVHALDWQLASDTLLDYLLDELGLDINARNAKGMTPLMSHAEFATVQSITRMLERGADPTATDAYHRHVSWHAIYGADGGAVRRLLERAEREAR